MNMVVNFLWRKVIFLIPPLPLAQRLVLVGARQMNRVICAKEHGGPLRCQGEKITLLKNKLQDSMDLYYTIC